MNFFLSTMFSRWMRRLNVVMFIGYSAAAYVMDDRSYLWLAGFTLLNVMIGTASIWLDEKNGEVK